MRSVDSSKVENAEEAALHNALEILRDLSHVRMLPRSELERHLTAAGLRLERCTTWINHREVREWMKITNAPERIGPLKVVMAELARRGATAGLNLRVDGDKILFDHRPALTVAVKPLS